MDSESATAGSVMDNVSRITYREVDFADHVRRLRPGDHAIVLYSTDEQRDEIAHMCLSHILKEDSVVMYVSSERSPESVRKSLSKRGIDVISQEKNGSLYIQDGYYTIPPDMRVNHADEGKKMIAAFAKTVYSANRKGGLGGIVETEGLFRYQLAEPLLSVESFFGKKLGDINREKMPPMIGICLYKYDNLLNISGERQAGLIDSHSHAFFATPESDALKAEVDSFVAGVSKIVHQSLPTRWIVVPEGWNYMSVEADGKKILLLLNELNNNTRFLQVPGFHSGEERKVGEKGDRMAVQIETVPHDLRYRLEPKIRESLPADLRFLHMIFW